MARPRKKELSAPQTESLPADSTPPVETTLQSSDIVHGVSESPHVEPVPSSTSHQIEERLPEESEPVNRTFASGHIANPTAVRRESHVDAVSRRQVQLPSKLTLTAGDARVSLIDKGDNSAGIGILVVFNDGRKPTEAEKDIIRSVIRGEDGNSGFSGSPAIGMWHKAIVRENEFADEVPPSRPIAIRLDAERRVQQLAEALREHANDPVGYAEMVRSRREEAANADRIPD